MHASTNIKQLTVTHNHMLREGVVTSPFHSARKHTKELDFYQEATLTFPSQRATDGWL